MTKAAFAVSATAVLVALALSACNDDSSTEPSDATPPAAVADLSTATVTSSSVTLSWTAPGDDGDGGTAAEYDLRYMTSTISEPQFESATRAPSVPVPAVAGTAQLAVVPGLSANTRYTFALKAADDAGNWSTLSNVATATTQPRDTTAPSAIADLVAAGTSADAVTLSWTAPGDDGDSGTASTYDVRYTSGPMTESGWSAATLVPDPPDPAAAGSSEGIAVSGLAPGDYVFAIKTGDEEQNWSALSNSAFVRLPPGPEPTQLTFDPAGATDPAWSPDGTQIAFSSNRNGNGDIYVIPLAGGEAVQITDSDQAETDPTWSHATLAFTISPCPYSAPGCVSVVADMGGTDVSFYPFAWTNSDARMMQPSWAPDGERFAFSANRWEGGFRIYTMRPNVHDTPQPVTTSDLDVEDREPAWSPDGMQIAFASTRRSSRSVSHIWIKTFGSVDLVQLTSGPASDESPAWSPDGSAIVFASNRSGAWDLWMIDAAAGADPSPLTWGLANDTDPAWSPDGTTIAFSSDRDGTSNIWLLPLAAGAASGR